MDTVSHALWGYAALHRRPRLAGWGALAGAAPDLLYFLPMKLEHLVERGAAGLTIGAARGIWRASGPPLPPELVEAYFRYYVWTHSLVVLAAACAVLWVVGRRDWIWLAVPYALHILMDIPTHERYQTRPFHPLADWHVTGVSWSDPRIFWPNVAALVAVFWWIRHRRRAAITSARRGAIAP